ncbi:MAG: extracellular solute-binding protein [Clostridiales bacterium]|nr:extracellular solute-binding protein [Clostridiales bacterium]
MRRLLTLVLAIAMLLSLMMVAPASAAEPTKLEFWTFQALHVEFYEKMAEIWNERNPDRQIELVVTSLGYDDMHNKLLIALQSGTGAPDFVDIEIGKYANYLMGETQLVPLNRVVEPELDNIVRSRVDIYAKDGNYYGICFHVGASVTYYNQEILEAAGVDVNSIITWDDFAEAGKVVLEKTGVPMATVEANDPWFFLQTLSQQGSDLLTPEGEPNVNSDAMKKALGFYQQMVKDGTAMVAPGGGHHAEEYYGFMNFGGAASVTMPFWYMGRFTDYMPDLKGKMLVMPNPVFEVGQPRSVGLGGTGTSVTNQSQHQDLAVDFLGFAKLSEEGNLKIWEIMGFDPIRKSLWGSEELKKPNKFIDYFANFPFDALIEVQDEIPAIVVSESLPKTMTAVRTSIMTRVFEGMEDIDTVLAEEQALLEQTPN